jgi:hypothetical protein
MRSILIYTCNRVEEINKRLNELDKKIYGELQEKIRFFGKKPEQAKDFSSLYKAITVFKRYLNGYMYDFNKEEEERLDFFCSEVQSLYKDLEEEHDFIESNVSKMSFDELTRRRDYLDLTRKNLEIAFNKLLNTYKKTMPNWTYCILL